MSEEPLFDPSLKKRKKKQVAFTEDPLGADADPTLPAPTTIDDVTTNGDTVDMGPKTVHEQMAQNERSADGEDAEKKEDDEFKAMFGDLKKKKKKKDIPLDLVRRVFESYRPSSHRHIYIGQRGYFAIVFYDSTHDLYRRYPAEYSTFLPTGYSQRKVPVLQHQLAREKTLISPISRRRRKSRPRRWRSTWRHLRKS